MFVLFSFFSSLSATNLNVDENDTPSKNWRSKQSSSDKWSANGHTNAINVATTTVELIDDPFTLSSYLLVALTILIILLILNWYRKGRKNIRTRRKYFSLNRLGLGI